MEVIALDFVKAFTNEQLKTEVPEFNVGDTVKVYQRIVEGQRVRTQIFEGTVIARKNGGISETFAAKNKGRSLDAKLAKATKWVAIAWLVLTLALCLIP